MTAKDVFKIGRLGKTHGVKGEVSFHFTDDVFDRVDADYVFVETEGLLVPFFFEEYRFRSDATALVKFADIDDANRAAELTGCDVYFPRELCEEEESELSWQELVGYTLVDSDNGQPIGEITGVDLSKCVPATAPPCSSLPTMNSSTTSTARTTPSPCASPTVS